VHLSCCVRRMTIAERDAIYRKKYWTGSRCDDLPAGVDYCVFDGSVNSGVTQSGNGCSVRLASRWTAISETILCWCKGRRSCGVGAVDLRPADEFLRSLRTFPTFGKGWTRRVNDLRATALGMVGEEAEEVATPEQVMKLASAIEPIWRIPIATSPCPARAWRHYPEVRRSPRLSGSVSLRRSTRPRSGPRARRPRFGCHRRPSSRLPLTGLLWLRCCRPGVRGSDPVALVGGELVQIPSGRAIGRHGRGSPASCVRARGVSRWRHLAGLRRQFRATSDPHPCPVDRGLCDRQSTGRLGMKLIGWVCLFHGGAAVLVLALAMAVGLL
jgi:hypothetical protein